MLSDSVLFPHRRVSLLLQMESSPQFVSSPFCTGVVDLVSYGHISGREGISLLCAFRKMGPPDGRRCAVSALRYLLNISDIRLARSCRVAFYELHTEDMWDLFTLNFEAVARAKAAYEEVVPVGPSPQATAYGIPGYAVPPTHL